MTRENKLALIIGFGLFLVVGILVSDHFSSATQRAAADLAGGGIEATRSPGLDDPAFLQQLTDEGPPQIPVAGNGTRVDSLSHREPARPDGSSIPRITLDDHPGEITMPHITGGPSTPPAQPIGYKWYVIKPGETLSGIAKRTYGDDKLWQQLAEVNEDRINNPEIVPSGVTIRLPDSRANLLTLSRGGVPTAPAEQPRHASSRANASGSHFELYEIQEGESLSKVASKFLGTGNKWRVLYELNRDVISNPDNVPAGTKIKVPVSG